MSDSEKSVEKSDTPAARVEAPDLHIQSFEPGAATLAAWNGTDTRAVPADFNGPRPFNLTDGGTVVAQNNSINDGANTAASIYGEKWQLNPQQRQNLGDALWSDAHSLGPFVRAFQNSGPGAWDARTREAYSEALRAAGIDMKIEGNKMTVTPQGSNVSLEITTNGHGSFSYRAVQGQPPQTAPREHINEIFKTSSDRLKTWLKTLPTQQRA